MTQPTLQQRRRSAVIDFGNALVMAALNRILHARDHRFVTDTLADVVTMLQRAAQLGVEMPLSLQFSDDRLHHDGAPLDGPSLQARSLLRCCAARDIAVLAFLPTLTADELNSLFDLLLLPQNVESLQRHHRDTTLAAFGIRNVRVTLRSPGAPSDRRQELDDRTQALHSYQALAECLQQNHARAHRDQELAVDDAAGAVERTVADFDEPSMLLALATQDDVDRFTVGHSVRVALLALQVARHLHADRDQMVRIGSAALLHDIGKSKVPQEILFKQGRLSAEEWHWMAQHPRLGAQLLLEQHDAVDPRAIGAAFCHHMGPNGEGYPQPTLPVAPSGISRLVRVCDVFEALTSVRPYKRALTAVEAYAVMFRNERDFDPHWLRLFARTIGLFPTGTRLQLTSGAEAMVVEQTRCPERPIVQLLSGPDGTTLPADHPPRATVGELLNGQLVRIQTVSSHDRCIELPELDPTDPTAAQPSAAHACLSSAVAAGTVPAPAS